MSVKDWKQCPGCGMRAELTPNEFLRHVVACEEVTDEGKSFAVKALALREKKANEPVVCCKLRKKVAVLVELLSEESSGVPDSELLDVMTFEKSEHGRPVVTFRFCPWCGVKWVRTGAIVEAPPRGDHL